jgi:hypothetical protein
MITKSSLKYIYCLLTFISSMPTSSHAAPGAVEANRIIYFLINVSTNGQIYNDASRSNPS